MRSTLFGVAAFAAGVYAHGNITSPPARVPGPAMAAVCGQNAVDIVLQDGTTPLEDVKDPLDTCNLFQCRGAVFEDNKDKVQTFTPGQVVPMTAQIPIPHEGPMNVSIIDTASNKAIGDSLITFASYADEKLPELPANNTAFSVTIPPDLSGCTVAGECMLQWFWFGTEAKQTYESCVDFVMAPAGTTAAAKGNATVKSVKGTGKKVRRVRRK